MKKRLRYSRILAILVLVLLVCLIFLWPFTSKLAREIFYIPWGEGGHQIEIKNVIVEPETPCITVSNSTLDTNPVLTIINYCDHQFLFSLNESQYTVNMKMYERLGLLNNKSTAWPMNWDFNETLRVDLFENWRLKCVYFSSPKYNQTCFAEQIVPNSTMCFLDHNCNNLVLPPKMSVDISFIAGKWVFRGKEVNISGELLWT